MLAGYGLFRYHNEITYLAHGLCQITVLILSEFKTELISFYSKKLGFSDDFRGNRSHLIQLYCLNVRREICRRTHYN